MVIVLWCGSWFYNYPAEEEEEESESCLLWLDWLLPRGAVGWSAVFVCGICWP